MVRASAHMAMARLYASSRSSTSEPKLIRPRRMEKRSGSCKPRYANGHMPRAYLHSDQRAAELPNWLHRYNWHRPHGSLKAQTPISRLGLTEDNVLRLHT